MNLKREVALERQPRPTGVCLADIQVPPKIREGRPSHAIGPRSWGPIGQSRPAIEDATPGL